jgi:hypothetical protein
MNSCQFQLLKNGMDLWADFKAVTRELLSEMRSYEAKTFTAQPSEFLTDDQGRPGRSGSGRRIFMTPAGSFKVSRPAAVSRNKDGSPVFTSRRQPKILEEYRR